MNISCRCRGENNASVHLALYVPINCIAKNKFMHGNNHFLLETKKYIYNIYAHTNGYCRRSQYDNMLFTKFIFDQKSCIFFIRISVYRNTNIYIYLCILMYT